MDLYELAQQMRRAQVVSAVSPLYTPNEIERMAYHSTSERVPFAFSGDVALTWYREYGTIRVEQIGPYHPPVILGEFNRLNGALVAVRFLSSAEDREGLIFKDLT